MSLSHKIEEIGHYGDLHHPPWLDVIRIAAGIAIFIKGIFFINNPQALVDLMNQSNIKGWTFILEHHIAFTYLVGGILIALGLITRIAILFELPVFFGSIFCYITKTGFFSVYSDFVFSLIIFAALIFFLMYGPGPWSLDTRLKEKTKFD